MKRFDRTFLPFDEKMKSEWDKSGCIIIENFYSDLECDNLRIRADSLVKEFDPNDVKSVFDTIKQEHASDDYFLKSGDKIGFFLKIRHLMKMAI